MLLISAKAALIASAEASLVFTSIVINEVLSSIASFVMIIASPGYPVNSDLAPGPMTVVFVLLTTTPASLRRFSAKDLI